MSAKKKGTDVTEEHIENIDSVISRSEAFIEKYQKQIIYAFFGIIVIVGGYFLYKTNVMKPKEISAQTYMASCQRYFEADSFKIALNGNNMEDDQPGACIGFLNVKEEYGMTESANLASAYAGICYFKMGQYEQAVQYLKDFDGNASISISPIITGLLGDAYVELKDYDKAEDCFKKAISAETKMSTPIYLKKLGILYESQGKNKEALEAYTTIKDDYSTSGTARDIEKYIERVAVSAN